MPQIASVFFSKRSRCDNAPLALGWLSVWGVGHTVFLSELLFSSPYTRVLLMSHMSQPSASNEYSPYEHDVRRKAEAVRIGIWLFLAALGMFFFASMLAYAMIRITGPKVPELGTLTVPLILYLSSFLLIASGQTMHWAWRSVKRERQRAFRRLMLGTAVLAFAFLVFQSFGLARLLENHATVLQISAAEGASAQTLPERPWEIFLYLGILAIFAVHAMQLVAHCLQPAWRKRGLMIAGVFFVIGAITTTGLHYWAENIAAVRPALEGAIAETPMIAPESDDPAKNQHFLYLLILVLVVVHAAHLIGGLIPLAIVTYNAMRNRYDHEYHAGVTHLAMYWHFLDAVWMVMFSTFVVLN